MTQQPSPTLAPRPQHHSPRRGLAITDARARDFAEIQERMLVPLYEAVYERLEVGPGVRLLGLGCGSGLALLLAAGRGAAVTGVEPDERRLRLARERLPAAAPRAAPRCATRLPATPAAGPYDVVTAFEPPAPDRAQLRQAAGLATAGGYVVLAGWGPAERCATAAAMRVAGRLADPAAESWHPAGRDDLEELALAAGLRPDGSGRVACPFGYADLDSAVRGLLSTGHFDAAIRATDLAQVVKELAEAVHPYQRRDGTVWMPNIFRYLIARPPRRR